MDLLHPGAVEFRSYARLRHTAYEDDALEGWAVRFVEAGWSDCRVFFKHEEEGTGPALARRFHELAGG